MSDEICPDNNMLDNCIGGGQRAKIADTCRRPRNDFTWIKEFHRVKKQLDCYRFCKINWRGKNGACQKSSKNHCN